MSTYDFCTSVLLYMNHLVLDCVWMIRLSFTLHTVSWFMTWLLTCDSFNGMNVSLSQVILHTMRLDHCSSWVLRNDWFWLCQDKNLFFFCSRAMRCQDRGVESSEKMDVQDIWSRSDGSAGSDGSPPWKPDCASGVDFEAHCTCSSGTLAFSSPDHPPLKQYKHPKTNTRIGAAVKLAAARHYSVNSQHS